MNLYYDLYGHPRFAMRVAAPTKVVDIEIGDRIPSLKGLGRYRSVLALVRLHKVPVRYLALPVENGTCTDRVIAEALIERLEAPLLEAWLADRLREPLPVDGIAPDALLNGFSTEPALDDFPLVTVCITTRDRTDELVGCLEQLRRLDYPQLEVVVVDNAPSDDATGRLVEERFSEMRYIVEERPGQSWARNRGFAESTGEIIAFTDDDVRVDPGWVTALVRRFQEDPETAVVTGLIVPFWLETDAQVAIESYAGMGRGFRRTYNRVYPAGRRRDRYHIEGYAFGAGANMAFRRSTLEKFGGFDPVLGPGSAVGAGEDPEMFFRVLEGGGLLVYEPTAVVRHRHRPTMPEATEQMRGWVSGFSAYLARICATHPRLARRIVGYTVRWWYGLLRTAMVAALVPASHPPGFPGASLRGALRGLLRFWRSYREARRRAPGAPPGTLPKPNVSPPAFPWPRRWRAADLPTAIRTVDLTRPIAALADLAGYYDTLILVKARERMLGRVLIRSLGRTIGAQQLRDEIARGLDPKKLLSLGSLIPQLANAEIVNALLERYLPAKADGVANSVTALVSVIVPTCDRPDDLRRCLRSLARQDILNPFEIIVVDNKPASGKTPPVVREFSGVRFIDEPTPGASAARNAGFVAARAEIVAMIDDDAVASESWLRQLIAPFARKDVAMVCGNILPAKLDLRAEKRFESSGGLGRGFERFEIGPDWFSQSNRHCVPIWEIGTTANCAVRRSVLADPEVGLMDELLGPATPTSACEDLYLYYRIAKRGHTMVYEPNAYVFHSHRTTLRDLRRQIYRWGKGQYAYQLNTMLRDGDSRAAVQMLLALPSMHLRRVLGRWKHPRSLILPEILGHLAGPFAYALARLRGPPRRPLQLDRPALGPADQPGHALENSDE